MLTERHPEPETETMAPTIPTNATLTLGYDATEQSWVLYADGRAVRFYHTQAAAEAMLAYYGRGGR